MGGATGPRGFEGVGQAAITEHVERAARCADAGKDNTIRARNGLGDGAGNRIRTCICECVQDRTDIARAVINDGNSHVVRQVLGVMTRIRVGQIVAQPCFSVSGATPMRVH